LHPTEQVVTLRMANGELLASRGRASDAQELPELPTVLAHRLADAALMRAGAIGLDELHPLGRTALFPEAPEPGFPPLVGPGGSRVESDHPRRPVAQTWAGEAFPLRCGGRWHRIALRDGRITALDHTDDELQRERVMRALGGPVPRCVTFVDDWSQGAPGRPI